MSENLRTFTKALYSVDHVMRLTNDKTWNRKAPCADWKGKDVYEHLMGGVKMVHSFTTTGKGPKSTPKFGADPKGAWAKLRDTTLEALDQPGSLQTVAQDPFGPEFGPMPIDDLIGFMSAELAVHAWDLARTAKVDERLDPALCKAALATWKSLPEEVLRSESMMGAPIKPGKGADTQTRLLNFVGREV